MIDLSSKSKSSDYSKLSKKDFKNDIDTFFGLELDDEQIDFRDTILDKDINLVAVDAKAGTGKTTIAVCTAILLVEYGYYNGITYVVSPTNEMVQGYLPGSIEEKSEPYMEPLYEALLKANKNPVNVINSDSNIQGRKVGTAYVDCMTHTFLRGCNIEGRVVILDEVQNYFFDSLKKTGTRLHDSNKVILIGHTGQCDLYKKPDKSGYYIYLKALEQGIRNGDIDWAKICKLSHNHRGKVSQWFDSVDFDEWRKKDYEQQKYGFNY